MQAAARFAPRYQNCFSTGRSEDVAEGVKLFGRPGCSSCPLQCVRGQVGGQMQFCKAAEYTE